MREYTPDPRLYEMMTILSPDVPEDDLPAQIETIAAYITTAGGTVNETLRESPWGRRRLAYSIRHAGRDIRDGFYTVFHFTLDPSGVRDIERDLKLNDQVMRFLITHFTPRPDAPGAAPEGDEAATVDAEQAATSEESSTDSPAPAADAVSASETTTEAADTAAPEVAEPAEVAESADAAETTETAATDAPAEEAAADEAPGEEPESDQVAAEVSVDEDAPAAEEESTDEAANDEIPAEPTAPAKDDEEA